MGLRLGSLQIACICSGMASLDNHGTDDQASREKRLIPVCRAFGFVSVCALLRAFVVSAGVS
jgi:hypothetical protein